MTSLDKLSRTSCIVMTIEMEIAGILLGDLIIYSYNCGRTDIGEPVILCVSCLITSIMFWKISKEQEAT